MLIEFSILLKSLNKQEYVPMPTGTNTDIIQNSTEQLTTGPITYADWKYSQLILATYQRRIGFYEGNSQLFIDKFLLGFESIVV